MNLHHRKNKTLVIVILLISFILIPAGLYSGKIAFAQGGDTTPPTLNFVQPTPPDSATQSDTWAYINVTTTDASEHSAFIDWNKSLIGYWAMDSYNSTSIFDNSSYNNFAEFKGGVGAGNITTAKRGQGLRLDGIDDRIEIPDNTLYTNMPALTISLWFKLNEKASDHGTTFTLYTKRHNGAPWNSYYAQIPSSTDKISFHIANTIGEQVGTSDPTIIQSNIWYHFVGVYDGYNVYHYLNGQQTSNIRSITGTVYDSSGPLIIGSSHDGVTSTNGTIDEVLLFNRALTQQEILALYQAGTYRLEANFTNLGDGLYDYQARAIDSEGNVGNSETRTLTIDSGTPPPPPICGNNITEQGEVCDGSDLNTQTCISQGYQSGTLSCLSDCSGYDFSGCTGGNEELIPPDRLINWSNVGIPGGIPYRTTICANVVTDYQADNTGKTDVAPAIQQAVDNCLPNQVVYIPQGRYVLNQEVQISNDNITVRGDGPDQTLLIVNTTTRSGIFIGHGGNDAIYIDVINGSTKGSTNITLTDASTISVGDYLVIDQENDPKYTTTETWNPEVNCTYCGFKRCSSNHNITGWLCGSEGNSCDEGKGVCQGGKRALGHIIKVTSKNGNNISFEPELYWTFNQTFEPKVLRLRQVEEYTGIEDLYIGNTNDAAERNLWFYFCAYCWIKNLDITNARYNLWSDLAYRNEYRDSYVHDSWCYRGDHAYGINIFNHDTANLIENNIFEFLQVGSVSSNAGGGNVFAYNYYDNSAFDWPVCGEWGSDLKGSMHHHGGHPIYNLFEGNIAPIVTFDYIHGSSSHATIFRNRYTGYQPDTKKKDFAVRFQKYQRYNTVIGNILGTQGLHNVYEIEGTNDNYCQYKKTIYALGDENQNTCNTTTADPLVKQTLIRHGNYDYVTNSVIWDENISNHNLPDSLYLNSKPAWWTPGLAWPPFGPDANMANNKIPAQMRFEQISEPMCGNGKKEKRHTRTVFDDSDMSTVLTGNWISVADTIYDQNNNYIRDDTSTSDLDTYVTFTLNITKADYYEVYYRWPQFWGVSPRADEVPVTVIHRDGINTTIVNQTDYPISGGGIDPNDDASGQYLGSFYFDEGTSGAVIVNASSQGYTGVDSVRLIRAYDEECDDGNLVNGDGCSSDCTIENEITGECINGQAQLCPNQVGVCQGSQEACTDGMWPGCDYSSIPNYESTETLCDSLDNDCDGQTDEGCETQGLTAFETQTPITIDGLENDWGGLLGFIPSTNNISGFVDNNNDSSANFSAVWDTSYLYIAIKVMDDSLFDDSPEIWQDDSVELYLDGLNNGCDQDCYGPNNPDDHQYIVDLANNLAGNNSNLNGEITHAITSYPTEGYYFIEFSIPWSNLETTPSEGTTIGFDIAVNDDDQGGNRDSQIIWNGNGDNYFNTSVFGNLVLSATIYCGNNVCDPGESCSTCPQDCGSCSGGGGGPGGGGPGGPPPSECQEGDEWPCGSDIGICQQGTQTCINGEWSSCQGETTPTQEICNQKDDDCNNLIDDGITCECLIGETKPCGSNIGECSEGFRFCDNGLWGSECLSEIKPTPELCDNNLDEDCDGVVDNPDICLKPEEIPTCQDGPIPETGCWCGEKAYTSGYCYEEIYQEEPRPPFPWLILSAIGALIMISTLIILIIKKFYLTKEEAATWRQLLR